MRLPEEKISSEQPQCPSWTSREGIASYILQNEDKIRLIARRKLPHESRSAYGSDDVFSTVVRRVDALAAKGLLRAQNEAQLWALIRRVVELVSLQRLRLVDSLQARTGEDAAFWSGVSRDVRRCNNDTEAFVLVFHLMMSLDDATDRQIFLLRLRGVSHLVIAEQIGTTEEGVKQRWQRIRTAIRRAFDAEQQA